MQRRRGTPEFQDFIGHHKFSLSFPDLNKVGELASALSSNTHSYPALLALFDGNVDDLVRAALDIFSRGKLSPQAMVTLLDFRAIHNGFNAAPVVPLLNTELNLTHEAHQFLGSQLDSKQKRQLESVLRTFPQHECCLLLFPSQSQNEILELFLQFAYRAKILFKNPTDASQYAWGSASVRDAVLRLLHGDKVKQSFPRLGRLSIKDIEHSVRRHGRYCFQSFPGIEDTTQFHGLTAAPFFVTVHDQLHRALISSLENVIFDGLIRAIDVVREKTGMEWSKEIWDALEMELDIFLDSHDEPFSHSTPSKKMDAFCLALNGKVASEKRPIGLFSADASIDTTWILMIDFALNRTTWAAQGLDPEDIHTRNPYYPLYQAAKMHKDALLALAPAAQVAWVKNHFFNLPANALTACQWVKTASRHLQVEIGGKPLGYAKASIMQAYQIRYTSHFNHLRAVDPDALTLFFQSNELFTNGGIYSELRRGLQLNPEFDAEFIQAFQAHDNWLKKLGINHIDNLVQLQRELDVSARSKFENYFNAITPSVFAIPQRISSLVKLHTYLPKLARALFKEWVSKPEQFFTISMDQEWEKLTQLFSGFDQEINALFDVLSTHGRLLLAHWKSNHFLDNVLTFRPQNAESLVNVIMKPQHFTGLIQFNFFVTLSKALPPHLKNKLIQPILCDSRLFTQLLTSSKELNAGAAMRQLNALFPGHEAILSLNDFNLALAEVVKAQHNARLSNPQSFFTPQPGTAPNTTTPAFNP